MEGGLNRDIFIKEDTVTIMVQPINLKKEHVSFCKRDIVNTVKKQRILFITISILVMLLTACSSSKSSFPQLSKDGVPSVDEVGTIVESAMPYSEINGSAEPAVEFSSAEEAVKEIKAVKATDPKKMAHPDDFKLYDKKYVYLLKETPLPGFKQTSIMIILQGTSIIYQTDGGEEQAVFSWIQGGEADKKVEERISRFSLKRFKDTKFFFGELFNDVYIYWWENGDQFSFRYPADSNVSPEDIIKHLEVVRYDL